MTLKRRQMTAGLRQEGWYIHYAGNLLASNRIEGKFSGTGRENIMQRKIV